MKQKKILSVLLVLCMALSMMPMAALAEEADVPQETAPEETVPAVESVEAVEASAEEEDTEEPAEAEVSAEAEEPADVPEPAEAEEPADVPEPAEAQGATEVEPVEAEEAAAPAETAEIEVSVAAEPALAGAYTITLPSSVEHGTISADKLTADAGETVTLTVTPDSGYGVSELRFDYQLAGEPYGSFDYPAPNSDGTYSFTMPAADATVSCSLQKEHTVTVDLGEKHTELAQSFTGLVGAPAIGTQVTGVSGSRIGMTVYADNEYSLEARISDLFFDTIGLSGNHYTHNGEALYHSCSFGSKPLSEYADEDAYLAERNSASEPKDGAVLYLLWTKPVERVTVTVEAPLCGTEISFRYGYETSGGNVSSDPSPVITVSGDAAIFKNPFHYNQDGFWTDNETGSYALNNSGTGFFQGTVQGGEEYYVAFELDAAFGYFCDASCKDAITVNGKAPIYIDGGFIVAQVAAEHALPDGAEIVAPTCTEKGLRRFTCPGCGEKREEEIPALGHTPAAAVKEKEVAASCETAGSYEEVVYCATCKAELSREKKTVPALGHDWGDWVQTKVPTETEEGIQARACRRDASHVETEAVEKLAPTLKANRITVTKAAYALTINSKKAQTIKSLGAKATGGKLTYKSSSKKVTVSRTGKVTVKKGFTGKATITITASGDGYATATKKVTVTVKPALTSVKNTAVKKIAVKWKKAAGVTGYQIQYSSNKKFTSYGMKTVKGAKNLSQVLRTLSRGKTYYVRIRTYTRVNGKTTYSPWSAVKSVKVN